MVAREAARAATSALAAAAARAACFVMGPRRRRVLAAASAEGRLAKSAPRLAPRNFGCAWTALSAATRVRRGRSHARWLRGQEPPRGATDDGGAALASGRGRGGRGLATWRVLAAAPAAWGVVYE